MKPFDIFLVIVSTFFLGTNMVAVKIGVGEFPPLFLMGLRFAIVALVLIWFVEPPKGFMAPVIALSVTMGTIHFGLFFIGMTGVDAAVSAIAFQLGIPFSVIFAWIILGDRFGWRRSVGIFIALLGVALIAGKPHSSTSLPHLFLILASAVAWGLAAVQIKKLASVSALTLTAWIALFSTPQLFALSFLVENGQWASLQSASLIGWSALVYAAICASIIGYGLWYYLIGKFSVSRIVPYALLSPMFGISSAIVILGDEITAARLTGGMLTLIGVAFVQWRGGKVAFQER